MLTIIHGADFHLDSPFSGLTSAQATARREGQRDLLYRLTQLAQERKADLVFLAGDLMDGRQTYRETAQALSQALGEIPCPVFLAPGNHDFYHRKSLYTALDWPDNVHIFKKSSIQSVELPDLGCVVYGRAFQSPREEQSPLEGFCAPQDGKIHLMVLHGDVGQGKGIYAPITPEQIRHSNLTYLALGHVHQYSGLQREGNTIWAYPGCPEGRGFDESGEKGVLCLTLEEGRCKGEFVPLGAHRYYIVTVDITGVEDVPRAVRVALPMNTRQDIYRIFLTGERKDEQLNLAHLTRLLSPDFYGLTLYDRTRMKQSLWARREEDTLTGLFLRIMERKCSEKPDNETLQMAVRFGLAALENGEDVFP